MKGKYLFVYGTLMKGMNAYELLAGTGARFVAEASIQGRLYDVGDYPAVVKVNEADASVAGELFVATDATMAAVDEYERYRPEDARSLFVREVTTASRKDNGEVVDAWAYFYNQSQRGRLSPAKRIKSGNYRLAKAN